MTSDNEARAVRLFADAGVPASGRLVRVATGWSNEVWVTESHVLRVASRRGPGSPAALSLPSLPVASDGAVSATGHERLVRGSALGGRTARPGLPFTVAWVDADPALEPVLLDSLAASIHALHAVELSAELRGRRTVDRRPTAGGRSAR